MWPRASRHAVRGSVAASYDDVEKTQWVSLRGFLSSVRCVFRGITACRDLLCHIFLAAVGLPCHIFLAAFSRPLVGRRAVVHDPSSTVV